MGKTKVLGNPRCAFYTHLGNVKDRSQPGPDGYRSDPLGFHPDPYLSPEPLQKLQDRAWNITGTQVDSDRIWFTRLSVLYDYAYVMPRLPDHMSRGVIDGLDVVSIQSWEEPLLGKTYPISPSQLYGVTFQADDTDAVRIFLDGEEIEHLVRIPPREGRPGLVMIASTDLSIPCTNELLAMGPVGTVEGENACLTWDPSAQSDAIDEVHAPMLTVESDPNIPRKRKRGFLGLRKRTSSKEAPGVSLKREDASSIPNGRLTVAGAGLGTVRWELRGRSFDGCQQLAMRLRSDQDGLEFCIKIMTADGGLFAFHSPGFEPPADATATFTSLPLHSGRWHTLVVPFCELDWKKLPQGIAPLPMKDVESIELSVVNPADTPVTLDLDHIDFERPRATRIAVQSSTHVLVGDTETVDTHPFIHLQSASQTTETLTTRATFHGAFVFTDLATGVYRLWSTASEAPDSEVGKELFVHVRNDSSLVSLQ